MAFSSIITNKIERKLKSRYDNEAESIFKGSGYDYGSNLSDWKSSMTPEFTKAIAEALEARELIKISVLKNCADDPKELASMLAERTHSQVVQVIGKKIVLYKEGKDKNKKIVLP